MTSSSDKRAQRLMALINPFSGGGKGKTQWSRFEPALRQHFRDGLVVRESKKVEDLGDWALDAQRSGFDALLVIGGDGTCSEVVNGLLAARPAAVSGPEFDHIGIAFLPGGSGNDFHRNFPAFHTAQALIAAIDRDQASWVDVGCASFAAGKQRFFLNALNLGLGGAVSARVAAERLKRRRISYLKTTFQALTAYRAVSLRISSRAGGEILLANFLNLALQNGRFCGGGMHMAPEARVDDGRLDLIGLMPPKLREWPGFIVHFLSGQHLRMKQNLLACKGDAFRIDGAAGVPIDIDGEPGGSLPIEVRVEPRALKLFVPLEHQGL